VGVFTLALRVFRDLKNGGLPLKIANISSNRETRSVSRYFELLRAWFIILRHLRKAPQDVLGLKTASTNSNPFRRYSGCSFCSPPPAVYVTKIGPMFRGLMTSFVFSPVFTQIHSRDPKDGELCPIRTKPEETLVEVRSDSDEQIDRQTRV